MNLLSVENITKSFGDLVLFENISFGINQGERFALIAKNGAGKTTLISILKGKDIPDSGEVVFRKDIVVAYLDQNPELNTGMNVIDALMSDDNKISLIVKNYEKALFLAERNPDQQHLDALQHATNRMDEAEAWDYENKVKQILFQLNIKDLDQPVNQLSGGQLKRVALAAVLIQEPDLMILDEPTNHLDMEMIEWLEHYIEMKKFSLLVVTHDRYFLDNVCTSILELDNLDLYRYDGNYPYYLDKKAEREAGMAAEIDRARNIYRRELEWMRRMPKARTTKSKSRIDSFYTIEEKAKQKKPDQQIQLSVKMNRLGSKILELQYISKAYGENVLLKDFHYAFKKGEKIGIVGKNGIGKSTLLNIILGNTEFDSGKIETGETVLFGYYSQQGIQLKEDKRIIDVVKDIAEYIPLANGTNLSASGLLSQFNFPPKQQHSFVSKLSGGEKRRLYLLTILMKNPNFLILDEPTNDLDIQTLQTFEDFLADFKGCVLIVSHDRYFIDKLCDHIFVFEGNGKIKDFPGNYTHYRIWADQKKEEEEKNSKQPVKEEKQTLVKNEITPKKLSYKEKIEFETLEKEITMLEKEKESLNEILHSGTTDHQKLSEAGKRYAEVLEAIENKTLRWLELSERV